MTGHVRRQWWWQCVGCNRACVEPATSHLEGPDGCDKGTDHTAQWILLPGAMP